MCLDVLLSDTVCLIRIGLGLVFVFGLTTGIGLIARVLTTGTGLITGLVLLLRLRYDCSSLTSLLFAPKAKSYIVIPPRGKTNKTGPFRS